jgi:alanyl-tRNA synthetase
MTQLDYLDDTFLFESNATFINTQTHPDKGLAVILNRTIFYPQGGGQPADKGVIENEAGAIFKVQDVRLDADGLVWHFGELETGEFATNESVSLKIDQDWRIQNAKNHSAGHLLDCAVEQMQLQQLTPTKGFHFPEGAYVEYEGTLDNGAELLPQLQTTLNQILEKDPAVVVQSLSYEEAQTQGIVAPAGKSARIVHFEGFAACGCGGTHMPSAKAIGGIRLRKIKSKKGKTKISYEVLVE